MPTLDAAKVAELAASRGLTATDVARSSGLADSTVRGLLAAGEPVEVRRTTVRLLADALDVTVDELAGDRPAAVA